MDGDNWIDRDGDGWRWRWDGDKTMVDGDGGDKTMVDGMKTMNR